jgi:hemin uptake protein HemP
MTQKKPVDAASPVKAVAPELDAQELLKGYQAVQIRLGDQLYTLRITRAGKLILTK